jgi:hypothetical protein
MRRGVAFVVIALMSPAVASAETLCVPSTSIPGCPTGSANEPTIQDAANNGHNGDTIMIGSGTFDGPLNDGGTSYTIVGQGEGKTIIQGEGVSAVTLSSGSSISELTINLANGTGNTGLALSGTATGIAITATEPLSTTNNIGVDLSGGSFSHGTVTLPVTGGDINDYGGVIGHGTVSDSSITAAVGVTADSATNAPTLERDKITGNQGVMAEENVTVDDTLITTVAGAAPETGIGMTGQASGGTLTVRHATVIGSDSAGSVGIEGLSTQPASSGMTSVDLASSIIRGYGASIRATAATGAFTATTTVTVHYSYYDPATVQLSPNGSGATASIIPDSHSGNTDPLFVNAATGNYHLQAGSPAIDDGDPAPLAGGESTTDLDGGPRAVAGRKGDAAISDVGAYEFQPHTPTLSANASPINEKSGALVTFTATGADASPGDSVSFRWTFGDGTDATGATVTHVFAKPGLHMVGVTATDLDGFTAFQQVVVAAQPPRPRLTRLRCKPKAFRAGHGTTISYRDTVAGAAATLTIERRKGRRWVKVRTLRRHDRLANKVKLNTKRLKAGSYRVVVVARDGAGPGRPATARFKVKR